MMYRNLNEMRYERKQKHQKRVFQGQLKQHHQYVESFVQQKANQSEGRKSQVAQIKMQKHQIEEAVRNMYVNNNFNIKEYDTRLADI